MGTNIYGFQVEVGFEFDALGTTTSTMRLQSMQPVNTLCLEPIELPPLGMRAHFQRTHGKLCGGSQMDQHFYADTPAKQAFAGIWFALLMLRP